MIHPLIRLKDAGERRAATDDAFASASKNHMTTKSRLTISSAVRRAYRRSDQFEKRRQLAQAWARYIAQPPTDGAVVPLRAGSTAS
jgi:hypothetical protein